MRTGLVAAAACLLVALQAGQAAAKTLPGFHSPSGNIRCLLVSDKPQFLLCDIRHAQYRWILVRHCTSAPYFVDWAGFSLGAKKRGVVACAGGPAYDPATEHPHYANLPYGNTWRRAGFACHSETTGVTCSNAAGYTLFISSSRWSAL